MIIEKIDSLANLHDSVEWKQISEEIISFWKAASGKPDQRYLLSGGSEKGSVAVNLESYISKQRATAQYESHLLMADIQIVLDGDEYLDFFPLVGNEHRIFFDEQRDLIFYEEKPEPITRVHLYPGICALILPGEAHMPCLRGESDRVRKMVVKIPLALIVGSV